MTRQDDFDFDELANLLNEQARQQELERERERHDYELYGISRNDAVAHEEDLESGWASIAAYDMARERAGRHSQEVYEEEFAQYADLDEYADEDRARYMDEREAEWAELEDDMSETQASERDGFRSAQLARLTEKRRAMAEEWQRFNEAEAAMQSDFLRGQEAQRHHTSRRFDDETAEGIGQIDNYYNNRKDAVRREAQQRVDAFVDQYYDETDEMMDRSYNRGHVYGAEY